MQQQEVIVEHSKLINNQRKIIENQQQQILRLQSDNTNVEETYSLKEIHTSPDVHRRRTTGSKIRKFRETEEVPSSIHVRQSERVAFTAYLDHNLDNLGIDHPIVYNKVILNEGSAYNPTSGMFTCPMDGLFAFYFSVSTNGVNQIVAKLTVNGENKVDAISDTYHEYHEAQGSNFVLVSLTAGQQVWIANYRWANRSVQDSDVSRFATFSGFYLY
ncbi:hypothetical protein ACF0H5_012536 [Mactra antiquata]